MTKTEEKREARIKEIAELTKKREEINARLSFLTGVAEASNSVTAGNTPPADFPWMKEIETLFTEHKQLRILQATALMQKKFPQYKIDRSKVHSVMAYLATPAKSVLKKEENERGLFSLKNQS